MTTTPGPSPIPRHPSEFACIDLINSAFTHHLGKGPGFDRLARWEWRAWFLSRHGIEVDPAYPVPIDQLATLRDQLRAILWQWARTGSLTARQTDALDAWVSKAPLRQRVRQISGRPGLAVEPADRDWTWAMARIAASAAELAGNGAPERLKVCANPDCSWMFYDHTLNRSQRFCSTSPCATVVRVRRFRRSGVRPSLLAGRCMRPTPRANGGEHKLGRLTMYTKIQVVFDAANPPKLARFWASAPGLHPGAATGGFTTWEDFGGPSGCPKSGSGTRPRSSIPKAPTHACTSRACPRTRPPRTGCLSTRARPSRKCEGGTRGGSRNRSPG
jgi:predicted RNA-binding Zn ribbon-like protein